MDVKVSSQPLCRHKLTGMKKTGCEIDHITGLMAAEAVVAFVHLHGWGFVLMEGAAGHAVTADLQPVAFGSLPGGNGCFDLRKQIQNTPRKQILSGIVVSVMPDSLVTGRPAFICPEQLRNSRSCRFLDPVFCCPAMLRLLQHRQHGC